MPTHQHALPLPGQQEHRPWAVMRLLAQQAPFESLDIEPRKRMLSIETIHSLPLCTSYGWRRTQKLHSRRRALHAFAVPASMGPLRLWLFAPAALE